MPAFSFAGCAVSNLLAFEQSGNKSQNPSDKHKFQNEFCKTYEEAYKWKYVYFIDYMERFAEYIGRDKLIELLKKAADENIVKNTKFDPGRTFSDFAKSLKSRDSSFWNTVLTWDIAVDSDNIFQVKVTECLWAKTFNEKSAGDIGYACMCYPDFSAAIAYHPKMTMERNMTIMQGHACCNHRWIWQT